MKRKFKSIQKRFGRGWLQDRTSDAVPWTLYPGRWTPYPRRRTPYSVRGLTCDIMLVDFENCISGLSCEIFRQPTPSCRISASKMTMRRDLRYTYAIGWKAPLYLKFRILAGPGSRSSPLLIQDLDRLLVTFARGLRVTMAEENDPRASSRAGAKGTFGRKVRILDESSNFQSDTAPRPPRAPKQPKAQINPSCPK
ncbi:unnamed protein product [Nesidiocoris tenuis]|uniref:Uncharacterized protein n=1 Tax=Nesidiocoris tenuis TaxID=355587 RepID=A0A6H5HS45_9HEMI|nr:unnamed protein product [Nesidiocoris tenuis]